MGSTHGSEDAQNLIKEVLNFEIPPWVRRVQQRIAESSAVESEHDPFEHL